jgi:hypothetical protein
VLYFKVFMVAHLRYTVLAFELLRPNPKLYQHRGSRPPTAASWQLQQHEGLRDAVCVTARPGCDRWEQESAVLYYPEAGGA